MHVHFYILFFVNPSSLFSARNFDSRLFWWSMNEVTDLVDRLKSNASCVPFNLAEEQCNYFKSGLDLESRKESLQWIPVVFLQNSLTFSLSHLQPMGTLIKEKHTGRQKWHIWWTRRKILAAEKNDSVCYISIFRVRQTFYLQSLDLVYIVTKHFDTVWNISNAPSAWLQGTLTMQTNLHEIWMM